MISKHYNTEFRNSRMVWTDEASEIDDNNVFEGHLQQASAEVAESLGLSFSKAYRVWCDVKTDVKEGDEIVDGFNTYTVRAVKELRLGRHPHLEVYVEREEDYG